MYKKFFTAMISIGVLFGISDAYSMKYNKEKHRSQDMPSKSDFLSKLRSSHILKTGVKTIMESPLCTAMGLYYLMLDREAIKNNPLRSCIFCTSLLASFVRRFTLHDRPNFLWRQSFFLFLAGDMLLFHRNTMKDHKLEFMIIGSNLLNSIYSDLLDFINQ